MRDHGEINFKNTWSYHVGPASLRRVNRVKIAAPRGMPRESSDALGNGRVFDVESALLTADDLDE